MSRPVRRRRQRREHLSMQESLELVLGPSAKALHSGDLAFADDEDRRAAIELHADELSSIATVWVERYGLPPEALIPPERPTPPSRRRDPFDAVELDELELSIDPPATTNGTRTH